MNIKLIKEFITACDDILYVLNLEVANFNSACTKAEDKLDEIIYSVMQEDLSVGGLQWKRGYSKELDEKKAQLIKDLKIVKNRLRIYIGEEQDTSKINFSDKIFISHSSKDVEFVKVLADFLSKVGIKNVFCSSIEGQGVKNGNKIEKFVRNEIIEDKSLVYIITKNFLSSSYCAHELGAGWILRDERLQKKRLFLLKMPDIEFKDIKGFVDGGDKMAELTENSFMTFIGELEELFNIEHKKPVEYKKLFDEFFNSTNEIIKNLQTSATQTKEEQRKLLIEVHEKIIQKLNMGEKRIIACMYFSDDRTLTLDMSKAVTNLMETKTLIGRGSTVTDMDFNNYNPMGFSCFLQQWVIDYIDENLKFKKELEKILIELNKQGDENIAW